MPLTRRYSPEIAPGEGCIMGMDFSTVLPPGVGISSATLVAQTNTNPVQPTTDIFTGQVSIYGRQVFADVIAFASASGKDYQLVWTVTDTIGQTFPRTALILCAPTS